MNAPATIDSKLLAPAKPEMASAHIAKMFANMFTAAGGAFTRAEAASYLEAVQGEPEWAIERASFEYRTGRRGDGKFAPRPGEFGKAVREIKADEVARRTPRNFLPPPRRVEPTPDEVARVHALARQVKAICQRSSESLVATMAPPVDPRLDVLRENYAAERAERWRQQAREELEQSLRGRLLEPVGDDE